MINKKLLKPINKSGYGEIVGTTTHDTLLNRDKAEQHPISAITDLQTTLDAKQAKLTAGAGIDITGDTISSSGGTTNGVTLDTDQTITGEKTFTKAIIINGEDGKKYFFDTDVIGGLSFSAPKYIINKVGDGGKNIIGFYDDGVTLDNGYIKCFNNRIIEVGTPTANTDAANKKYVDDAAAAGVTLDTAQTITGVKTFENGINNNFIEVNGKSLIIKNSNTAASYLEVESVYSGSGYKN